MHGKPSNLTAESYHQKIETIVALKSALARADCVETFDVNHDENGQIRGRVSLRHSEQFFAFNDVLADHPIRVGGIHSTDRFEDTADGDLRQAVEVEVFITDA